MTKLTTQKALFCKEYIIDWNGTQAAIRADYSEKTAQEQSSRLLSSVIIQEELARLMSARNERLEVDADWVLKQSVESFKYNAQEVHDTDGNPKMINAASASKFLEMCGKHIKIQAFNEKTTVEATVKVTKTLSERLTDASKR